MKHIKQIPFFQQCVEDLDIPPLWEDVSYQHDTCPSWLFKGYQIFIDHKDKNERELTEGKRFRIIKSEEYGYSDGWWFETDSMDEVLKEIQKPISSRPMSETLKKDKEKYLTLSMDMHLTSNKGDNYIVELTEDYEGDNFHLVIFQEVKDAPNEHFATLGFKTFMEVYDYVKKLQHGTLIRDAKINYIMTIRGIDKTTEFGNFIVEEYNKMSNEELNIEYANYYKE